MANINFSAEANGYNREEVDKYISMLQQEYKSAIAWGEENEAKFETLRKNMQDLGIYFTIDENNQNEVIEKVFAELSKTVAKIKIDADQKAAEIIDAAHEKSKSIVRQAMEKSIEIRTENTNIIKNLEQINALISDVLGKNKF